MNDYKTKTWITVIGIGCDGLEGLNTQARSTLEGAQVLAASEHYHALIADKHLADDCERLISQHGFSSLAEQFQHYKGRRIVVLTAGDPMHFGAGSALARRMGTADITVIPRPSAFSLACARMVWSVPDSQTISIHASHPAKINLHVAPAAKIVALGQDGTTPARVAHYLCERGFAASIMTVFCDMGGPDENRIEATAEDWSHAHISDLNTICVDCVAGPEARWWSRVPGLPEEAYTPGSVDLPREIRASVLSMLAPQPGETLWAMGAGSSLIGIEWLRSTAHVRAAIVETNPASRTILKKNATFLGVPDLQILETEDFSDQKIPGVVFLTGAAVSPEKAKAYYDYLKPDGRLVTLVARPETQAETGDILPLFGDSTAEIRIGDQDWALFFLKKI